MSIDKWLDDKEWLEKKKKREEIYNNLSEEEKASLEKKSIKNLVGKNKNDSEENIKNSNVKEDYFVNKVVEFKDWLDKRTYLKGDKSKIEMWISNLNRICKMNKQKITKREKITKKDLLEKFRKIPLDFLDEKTRIAINKHLHGDKKTSSDNYYLRKLNKEIEEKLKELKYYKILEDIIDT